MSRVMVLLKMNLKLLLRNKGFLFFLCITPVVSAVILNLKVNISMYENKEKYNEVVELETPGQKAIYVGDNTKFIIKVYDGANTELSEYYLNRLSRAGMFCVCRCDAGELTEKQVKEQAENDAFEDRAGALLYLKKDFDMEVMKNNYEKAFQIFRVSADERMKLFETETTNVLSQISHVSEIAQSPEQAVTFLMSVEEKMPGKQVLKLRGKEESALTGKQTNQKSLIGYAFAILTLGFLFCGVCAAFTVIEEHNNKVYMRAMLSKLGRGEYFVSKFAMAFLISVMQTVILGICIFAVRDMNFGISKPVFLLLIFCLGTIFCMVSLLLGILLGDVMSANYAVFSVWSISALVSGLYFSIDETSAGIKAVSYLMPQRWFIKISELLLAGNKEAYPMMLCVTASYLIICISVGSIGLKMKQHEE